MRPPTLTKTGPTVRRTLLALVLLVVALPQPARAEVAVAVFDGRGHGHGVGMAQDGAYWMGRAGASTNDILRQFYPGAALGKGSGSVRVAVVDAGPAQSSITFVLPNGGSVRDAPPGKPAGGVDRQIRAGESVTIRWDGQRHRVESSDGAAATAATAARTSARIDTATANNELTPRTAQGEPLPTTPGPVPTTTTTTTTPPATTSTTATTQPAPPSPTTTAPGPSTTTTSPPPAPAAEPLWVTPDGDGTVSTPARDGLRYRGTMQVSGSAGGGPLRAINIIDVETYLKGMGEVRDPAWPPAGLRAQAIAARTYALRAMAASGEICDTQRCQVYLGATAEYRAMSRAVDETAGQVLTYRSGLASAVYSANAGGISATREEGFGHTDDDYPYLRSAPYPTQDPAPWSSTVALADVASRLRYRGTLARLAVTGLGPSGRVLEVTLEGDAGAQSRTGLEVADALRLRSTLFTVRLTTADAAPPPPTGESFIQLAPERGLVDPALAHELAAAPPASGPTPTPTGGTGGLALWAAALVILTGAAVAAAARQRVSSG
ncbi:MAG: SpoIID/LytB domain-containing protein [Acidimicrobiales bacterium]